MKNLAMKRMSILGLVLIAASAVTAAVLPSKTNANDFAVGGLTDANTDNGNTCTVGGSGAQCEATNLSDTTGAAASNTTAGNTTS